MKRLTILTAGALAALAVAATAGDPVQASGIGGEDRQPLRCPAQVGVPVKAKPIRGLAVPAARREARRRGCELRVVRIDGKDQVITSDLRRDRVNVFAREGRVRKVDGIY